ncbi:Dus-domain-containing protein [Nadsonia fulvescens var. elongata DSM 6958]|uniref:tRNA-dihydrouridine(16/17) synthase [NAD(P)(+)] n=1 Tax=Nadsonia fulvescens var. elongata DSM 6958 TaxID=857566 RepID=A0A1E3PJF2_9ASCO|nr:Dus-domain-containing protein [Nadsonia fulvescens var. elongata DSM 6958]
MTTASNKNQNNTYKLMGRDLYAAMGSPKTILAPMVDQSELAWRILSRRYGADICYTPMLHARLFANDKKYRKDMWSDLDGDAKLDRPLVAQFCANNPAELLEAASHLVGKCDAVDLNLGCPQGIAKKGHYGSFLMEEWDLIHDLINIVHTKLGVPVTAKIRIFPTKEKSLEYAQHVLKAGAQFLTVHGRTREMKGQQTGLADWSYIKHIRDNIPADTVLFANGNVLYPEDITRCFDQTQCDAVMSAEGNLYNPAVFNLNPDATIDEKFPRVDKLLREYFEIVKSLGPESRASKIALKSHFFKILRPFLVHHTDIRNAIGQSRAPRTEEDLIPWESIVAQVEDAVAKIYLSPDLADEVVTGDVQEWGGSYKEVPYWRCQPYFRTVNGIEKANTKLNDKNFQTKKAKGGSENVETSTAAEVDPVTNPVVEDLAEPLDEGTK